MSIQIRTATVEDIADLVAFARANQIQQIELVTWAFNTPAQSLFRKLGFVPKLSRFELPSDPTNNWREKTDAKTEVRLAR